MSLVCKGRERHLEEPFLHKSMMGRIWRWHFLVWVRDPKSEGDLHVSRSVVVNVPGCQLGPALLFFNKQHQSSSYTRLWKVSQRPHCVPLAAGAAVTNLDCDLACLSPNLPEVRAGSVSISGVTSFMHWRMVVLPILEVIFRLILVRHLGQCYAILPTQYH